MVYPTRISLVSRPPERRKPAPGVHIFRGQANIVFLSVCTERRGRWLDDPSVARDLSISWELADAWTVGRYVLMPDHLHLFCAPVNENVALENWVTFCKRTFRRIHGGPERRFRSGGFHHRLRQDESYDEKWDYVRQNPVRAGLVARADDWPYAGELNELRW